MRIALLLICLANAAFAAPTFVQARADIAAQNVSGGGATATVTLPFSSNVTSGNAMFVSVGCNDCNGSTVTATDTVGSTYAAVANRAHGSVNFNSYAFCATAASTGANTVTIHFSPNATWPILMIAEYSGASCVIDGSGVGSGASLSPATGNITTANAADVIVCAVQSWASVTSPTVSAPYTQRAFTATADSGWLYDDIVSSTGTFTCPSTFTTLSNNNWIAIGAALTGASTARVRHRVIQ